MSPTHYKILLLSAVLVFAPLQPVLLTVGVLVASDFVTGVLAARKRGEAITSAGFKRTVVKSAVYLAVVLLAFLTEQYLTGEMVPLVKILSGFVGMTELKSCLENMEDLTGIPILKTLIDKLSQTAGDPPATPPGGAA